MADSGYDFFRMVLAKLTAVDTRLKFLEDRVSVLEDRTCSHESRLEDLENWQEKTDDKLDAS